MVIFKVFLRFNDKADQHISNSHKPRIRNKIPFISSMLTIVMMPGCLPQLRVLCSCCFSECLVAIATSCSGKRSGYYRNLGSLRAGTRHHGVFLRYGNSFPPTFPQDLLAHASPNDWPIVAKHANTNSRGSINVAPATIMSESDTECRLAERAAITAITVMSRSRSQGTEVTIVTGPFPFELSRDITENFSVMGTLFNPAVREAMGSLYQLHSEVEFPSITALVGRAHS